MAGGGVRFSCPSGWQVKGNLISLERRDKEYLSCHTYPATGEFCAKVIKTSQVDVLNWTKNQNINHCWAPVAEKAFVGLQ